MKALRSLALSAAALLAAIARPGARTFRSTGREPPSPTRSTRSGSPSTTSCIPTVEINYQSIGSGGGIRQLTNQTVFFGATDGPMTLEQQQAAPGDILHLPTVLGGVVPIYNIPGVDAELKFTGKVLADIISRQGHEVERPGDHGSNPGVNLPGSDITVVHRSDGSGTTYIFVDYLSKVSPEFKKHGRRRDLGQLARGPGRKGQRGRRRARQADAGLDRLRRADLRDPEQDRLRLGPEHGRRVRPLLDRIRDRGRRRRRQGDAARLPRLDHQRARQGRLPDLLLHLAPLLRESEGQAEVEDHGRLREVGADRRPEVRQGPGLRAAARRVVVQLEMEALKKIKV